MQVPSGWREKGGRTSNEMGNGEVLGGTRAVGVGAARTLGIE